MKRLFIVLSATLLLSPLSGSAGSPSNVPAEIKLHRSGEVLKTRSNLSKRIENFAVKNGANPAVAPEIADLIAACKYPRVLAAIAAKESGFTLTAVGKAGEIGAFQVIPAIHGHPGKTWREQAFSSERILKDLVSDSGGKLFVAVRRYNGSGPKAIKYANHVMAMAKSI